MHASFKCSAPNLLAEASAGDLFVSLGPSMVECVCALRCVPTHAGPAVDMPTAARLDPDADLPVVVVACRVTPGEPEYFPPGYTRLLSGATPIEFLEPVERIALRTRATAQAEATFTVSGHGNALLPRDHARD